MILAEILGAKGHKVFTIQPGATLAQVVDQLVERKCGSLVVCENEQVVGIITERDILRACARRQSLADLQVKDFMTTNLSVGTPNDNVDDVLGLMTDQRIRHLPVLQDEQLAGLISIGDLVKAQHDELSHENHYLKSYLEGSASR